MEPRYAIGIDLGTSNCVLAYADLRDPRARARVLPIRQLHAPGTVVESALLPSCFYYPTEAELARGGLDPFPGDSAEEEASFVVGDYAREQMNALPGRVIHSAKSWLAHAAVDRESPLLPFGSEEIPPRLRLSPVEASAAYLEYLRSVWDRAFARDDAGSAFAKQRIVVTVPASFDEGAQALTRKAAELAGYPSRIRLLEEPQAAFYAWIAGTTSTDAPSGGERFLKLIPALAQQAQTVLVCDVGGGTSDFSLFRIAPIASARALPDIERIAASDHLLLGGDNIDLALAHFLERQLKPGTDERLSRRQWNHLMPQARLLKEKILETEARPDEVFHVSVPGEGGSLFQSALSTSVTRAVVHELVLEGFFPLTRRDEMPHTRQSGLREIGLPYTADSAVSRHLAAFLAGREVDAVLFAGGTLTPASLRQRLATLIGTWQGRAPVMLALEEMSLAIAQGASYFGALLEGRAGRIRGGHARSVYLELQRDSPARAPNLVCVLPQGFEEGGTLELASPSFSLSVNRPVRFSAYTSNRRKDDRAGTLVPLDADVFHPLPVLHTTLALDAADTSLRKAAAQEVVVHLEAELTELGVMQLALVTADGGRRWRLEFNLRNPVAADEARAWPESESKAADLGVPPETLAAATERIGVFFGKKQALESQDNVKSLVKDLERVLRQERNRWSTVLLRELWPALYPGMTRRVRSLAHENAWLYLAGFALRPGFGADLDAWRMTQLWECFGLGLAHKKEKSAQSNWWMMWRRTAGGLSSGQQEQLFLQAIAQFRKSPAEFVEGTRLLGALESAPLQHRLELAEALFGYVLKGKAANQAHVFWTLTRLLGRVPLHAAADGVLPPSLVEESFARVESLDWKKQGLQALIPVFAAACRLTRLRAIDVDDAVRARVVDKLRRSGAKEEQLKAVQEYSEVSAAEREYLFGEELPAGLRLSGGADE
jgi:molecular chaperone DnaK (HSP70)